MTVSDRPPLGILVVDDKPAYRKDFSEAIAALEGTRLIGIAREGREALEKIERLKPDIVILSADIPVMDGKSIWEILRFIHGGIYIVTVGAQGVAENSGDGAAEGRGPIISKLAAPGKKSREHLERQLAPLIADIWQRKASLAEEAAARPRPEIVAVGASTGGPKALEALLSGLPVGFDAPVVIVQHMQEGLTSFLAGSLQKRCALPVCEASDGQRLEKGMVYLAPAGRQLRVEKVEDEGFRLRLTDDPPEHFCRPSVDYLFRSVAAVFGPRALAVILTGMGTDGTSGLRKLKGYGVKTIGQDEASCVVYGMPKAAKDAGLVDVELPIEKIAGEILSSFTT